MLKYKLNLFYYKTKEGQSFSILPQASKIPSLPAGAGSLEFSSTLIGSSTTSLSFVLGSPSLCWSASSEVTSTQSPFFSTSTTWLYVTSSSESIGSSREGGTSLFSARSFCFSALVRRSALQLMQANLPFISGCFSRRVSLTYRAVNDQDKFIKIRKIYKYEISTKYKLDGYLSQ